MEGVYVEKIAEKSSAKEVGVKEGDILMRINGVKVKSVSELQEQVSRYRPGDKISVTVQRGTEEKTFDLTLKNLQGNTDITKDISLSILGASFKEIDIDLKRRFGLSYGIQVANVGKGKFQDAGIKKDFIILKINNQKIYSEADVSDVIRLLTNSEEKAMFIIGAYHNGKEAYYAVSIEE